MCGPGSATSWSRPGRARGTWEPRSLACLAAAYPPSVNPVRQPTPCARPDRRSREKNFGRTDRCEQNATSWPGCLGEGRWNGRPAGKFWGIWGASGPRVRPVGLVDRDRDGGRSRPGTSWSSIGEDGRSRMGRPGPGRTESDDGRTDRATSWLDSERRPHQRRGEVRAAAGWPEDGPPAGEVKMERVGEDRPVVLIGPRDQLVQKTPAGGLGEK